MSVKHRGKTKASLYQKIIGTAAALSLLSVGAVATVSAFSDTGTASITATAGKIEVQMGGGATKAVTIPLGATLVPGVTIPVKDLIIKNNGTVPMKYTAAVGTTTGNLASTMTVKIMNGTVEVYSGKANAIVIPEQTIEAGVTQTLKMTYVWANGTAAVDNALMGTSGNTTLNISAYN